MQLVFSAPPPVPVLYPLILPPPPILHHTLQILISPNTSKSNTKLIRSIYSIGNYLKFRGVIGMIIFPFCHGDNGQGPRELNFAGVVVAPVVKRLTAYSRLMHPGRENPCNEGTTRVESPRSTHYCQWTKLTADQRCMATRPSLSPCAFNTIYRTLSGSNINFYYVFYPILISQIFILGFSNCWVGGGVLLSYHSISFSHLVDPRLILSTDHTRVQYM